MTCALVALLVGMFAARMFMRKMSNEAPLKARLGQLEQALFRARDECALVRKDHEEFLKKGGARATAAAAIPTTPPPPMQPPVSTPPPKELLEEVRALRSENLGLQDRDGFACQVLVKEVEIGHRMTWLAAHKLPCVMDTYCLYCFLFLSRLPAWQPKRLV